MTTKLLITGATGYVADQLLPAFRDRYDLVLVDVTEKNRRGERVEGVTIADLIDTDRSGYNHLFEGVEAVVHLGRVRRSGDVLDHYYDESKNVVMAYNVLRCAYEAGVPRVAVATSNHAADWYEHNLLHSRKMEMLDPFALPLSDNFYGWSKASIEHMGFLFACGFRDGQGGSGRRSHALESGSLRQMGTVMVRIGAPRDLEIERYRDDPVGLKRDLGAYISARDLTQLFMRAVEAPDINNEHGIPWQVVYGISNNTRAFWSLANARQVLGYQPEDDAEMKFASLVQTLLVDTGAGGRLGS
jgi:hypothetical protein